jgi:hypothetical protein
VKSGTEEIPCLQRACAQIAADQPVHSRLRGPGTSVANASATVVD